METNSYDHPSLVRVRERVTLGGSRAQTVTGVLRAARRLQVAHDRRPLYRRGRPCVGRKLPSGDSSQSRRQVALDRRGLTQEDCRLREEAAKRRVPVAHVWAEEYRHQALAVAIGEAYHDRCRRLYQSNRAGVVYGTRPEVAEVWEGVYSRGWHRRYGPARWVNAAAHWCATGDLVLVGSRGQTYRLPPLPAGLEAAWLPEAGLPAGLLAARSEDPEIARCWGLAEEESHWLPLGYAWHGVLVPERVAWRDYTAADIAAEPNAELRRAMCELYLGGLAAAVEALGVQPIQADARGELLEMPGGRVRLVRVTDPGTGRQYLLRVPPVCRTAAEAVAWTFGRQPGDYCPAVES